MTATVRTRASNLPAELSSFVGRRREVAEVRRTLSTSRLVTLSGPGGVGKTRLALHVAGELRKGYPDGIWLVELGQLHDRALLVHTVSTVLGVREQPGRTPEGALTDYLAGRRLLMVLDNCEHLVDACAALVTALISACPDLHVLATSREPLGLPEEAVLQVPSLAVPQTGPSMSLVGASGAESVELFRDRGSAVVPSFQLTADNLPAVAEICQRLDGLPLAIELAAVRLRVLSAQQIAQRLSDRYRLLSSGSRRAPPRQQTLHSCMQWSYELCSPAEQLLWARLSVFAGGFELDAVEEVCTHAELDREDVLDLISALVDKSIVIAEQDDDVVRYRMLESVRAFGAEQLQHAGEVLIVRRRHRQRFEQLVQQANSDWVTPRQVEWFARLDREHANLQAAVDFGLGQPDSQDVDSALRIVLGLFHFFWWGRGWGREGRHWLGQGLVRETGNSAVRARALLIDAMLAISEGDFTAADSRITEGQALAHQLGDPSILALANYVAGTTAQYRGELKRSIATLEQAISTLARANDVPLRLDLLLALAITAGVAGDEPRATACEEEMLRITEPAGECFHRSYALWVMGMSALQRGDANRAAELQQQSLRLRRVIGDVTGTSWSLELLAWAEAACHRPERAATLLGVADQLWETMGRPLEAYQHLLPYHAQCERSARDALGDHAFAAAFDNGRKMLVDDAISYSLREPSRTAATTSAPEHMTLSPREREVAELIAEGLSNKEIASRLVISQRTAEGHAERILTKLGFRSRAQVAAWVTTQRAVADGTDPRHAPG